MLTQRRGTRDEERQSSREESWRAVEPYGPTVRQTVETI